MDRTVNTLLSAGKYVIAIRSQRPELLSAASMNAGTGASVVAVDVMLHKFLQSDQRRTGCLVA
jgi:hypothetical protein